MAPRIGETVTKPKGLDDTWMWNRAQELIEEADRLQRSFFQLERVGAKRANWTPPADVFETATEIWIFVALPGVQPQQVETRLEGHSIIVSAGRYLPEALRRAAVHRLEIPHGRFVRHIALPPERRYEIASQELTNGCLAVSVRKID